VSSVGAGRAGVIFDLDGVIIDSEGLQYAAYSEVLRPFGVKVSKEEYGLRWIAAGRGPEHAVATYGLPITPDQLRRRKDPVYHQLLRAGAALMPGAAEALVRLGRRFPLALATNSNAADTHFVLDHLGIRSHFHAVLTRDTYIKAKPEADAFLAAASALGLPPAACTVIEDAFKGVLAAHRAGCLCIAVPNEFTRENDFALATRVVDNLDQVSVELIEELVGATTL
jgi:HAD superfamily hydrolase (TIGR01509 family)